MDRSVRPVSRGRAARAGGPPWSGELAAVVAVCAAVAFLGSCSQRPAEPVFADELDPAGQFGGDPFQVTAQNSSAGVLVRWRRLSDNIIDRYEVMRAIGASTTYVSAGEVQQPAATSATVQFLDTGFAPAKVNNYKIVGHSKDGLVTSLQTVAPASFLAPPGVEILDDAGNARSRLVRVRLRADERDTVLVALTPDLVGSFVVLGLGQLELVTDVDLGAAAANGEARTVHVGVRRPGVLPPQASDQTLVAFDPRLELVEANPVENPVELQLRPLGVELMRVALQRGDLAGSPWFDPTPTPDEVPDSITFAVDLVEGIATRQLVWVESQSDFGFARVDSIVVDPMLVAPPCTTLGACFTIEGGSDSTPKAVVHLDMQMLGATRMRFTEVLPLNATPWIDYADTLSFALSPGAGVKTIHAQFANDFDAVGRTAEGMITRAVEAAPPGR